MLTDTHSHLFWDSFQDDLDEIIQKSLDAKVNTIINVGTDLETSLKAIEQVNQKLSRVSGIKTYSTIGLHPHEAVKYNTDESIHNDLKRLEDIYKQNPEKVVGVGECGLDYLFEYHPDWSPSSKTPEQLKQVQHKLLKAQVELAKKLNLPLIIHTRDAKSDDPKLISSPENRSQTRAWEDVFEFINDWKGVFHCYSAKLEDLDKTLATNFYFSFAGTLTYPNNEHLRAACKKIPLERIVLETDCPFLPPQSKRGQRNDPTGVLDVAQLIADLKGLTLNQVAEQTTNNAYKIFNLK